MTLIFPPIGIGKFHFFFHKKNIEFSRFGLTYPPTLVIAKNLEENKIIIVLKWFLGNFDQFWKKLFFHPWKCQNTLKNFELDVDQMFLVILSIADTMRSAADTMCGAATTMHGVADMMHGAANIMHVRCGG